MKYYTMKIIVMSVIIFLSLHCSLSVAGDLKSKEPQNGRNAISVAAQTEPPEALVIPGLSVNSEGMDFGTIGPDSVLNGLMTFKNMTGGEVPWSIDFPEDWEHVDQGMAGKTETLKSES